MPCWRRFASVRWLAPLAIAFLCACADPTTPDDALPRKPLLSTLRLRSSRYPPIQLHHDDGSAEFSRSDTGGPWQLAALFRNPYPVPARVDEVWIWIALETGIGAPFQFALWETGADGRPAAALELSPVLGARQPFGDWGIYLDWTTVLPPGAAFGAGMQQLSRDPIGIGLDRASPFRSQTFFIALNGIPAWVAFEQLGIDDRTPMVRVSLSPVYTARPVEAPHPAGATVPIVLQSGIAALPTAPAARAGRR